MVTRLPNFQAFNVNSAVTAIKAAAGCYSKDLTSLEERVRSNSGWRHVLETLETIDSDFSREYSLINHLNGVRLE